MATSNGVSRAAFVAATSYSPGSTSDDFAHSISAARSRAVVRSARRPARAAASVTSRALLSTSSGIALPDSSRGAKKRTWRSAAAWKVRAWTPSTPSAASRARSWAAARAVKVTASTCRVGTSPESTR